MNKTFKKAIAVILSVLMVIMSVPFTALAAVGDYSPNIKLQFGTFFDGGATDYNDYSTSGSSGSDFSYSSLRGVPVDYKYKVTNGVASGTLYIDKDKANTYNVASESGYSTLSENLQFGVGDYFTMTVICENIKEIGYFIAQLEFNDAIELAGVYSYKQDKKKVYALGTESEMKAANKGTWVKGGTDYLRSFSTCMKDGLHANELPDIETNTSVVLKDDAGNTSGIQFSMAPANLIKTNTTSSEADGVFYDPATGEPGYTYSDSAIVATYAFKIVKEGNIEFNVKDATEVNNCYYIANQTDGIMPNEYTTYAKNYYDPSTKKYDGSTLWPGSTKITFMGKNQFVDTPAETTYEIKFNDINGKTVDTQTVKEGETPTVPSTNTADTAATPAGNKQHSHTTYSWPAVSAATANANYDEVAKVVTEDCTKGTPVVTEPTLDKPGSEVTSCTICGQVLETKVLPQLKGYDITVAKTAYGTTTLNSEDATNGKTTKVLANSTVTLTAQANKGAEFVGWKVANKLVSTNETYSFTAVADTEVTPVFTETAESTFVVVFIDMYGNVVSTQEVTSGANIKVPATAPIYPGYTFKGWALTNDEITALTEGKTIRAIYEKDATQTYTVKAAGATITVNGTDYTDKAENVAYDAKVTVTKAGATSWTVNGATVGYGESYSFFCASDIELTAVTKADDTSKTQVAIVSTTRPSATDCDVLFVATRTVADNETVVSQGFVYGKNVTASDLTLENVGNTASGTNPGKVRVIYNNTNASQIGLNYGLTAKTGVAGARAFVVTKDADGNVHTYYSEASLYDYNA